MSVFLTANVNAVDVLDGFTNQLGDLFVRSVMPVIDNDLEANMPEIIVQTERLMDRVSAEIAPVLDVMINGRPYVEVSRIDEIIESRENQKTYVSYVISVLKKCREGDRKAIATVAVFLLYAHGFAKLFI